MIIFFHQGRILRKINITKVTKARTPIMSQTVSMVNASFYLLIQLYENYVLDTS